MHEEGVCVKKWTKHGPYPEAKAVFFLRT